MRCYLDGEKEGADGECRKGAEAEMTVSNAAVPILRAASEEMRAKRLAVRSSDALLWARLTREQLEEKNRATYEGIARNRAVLERSQGQIDEILVDFQKVRSAPGTRAMGH